VYVGVLINPWDRTLPQENGFKDAYLELGLRKMLKGDALGVSRVKRWRGNDMGPLGWIRYYIVVRLKLGVWKR